MNDSIKRNLITVIKFSLSISILWYLFTTAQKDDQFENFLSQPKYWGWVGLGFISCILANLISFLRWRVMVRALGIPFTYFDAIRIGFIGSFFGLFAFGIIGSDTLRAFYVTRQVKDRMPEAICSVVADRVVGLITMFSFASLAFLLLDFEDIATAHPGKLQTLNYACRVVLGVTVMCLVGVFSVILAPHLEKTKTFQWLLQLPRIGKLFEKLSDVVLTYRSQPKAVLLAVVMSLGVNLCFVISIYSLAIGLTNSAPSFSDHLLIEPISMVANAAPLPGGLGGMELALKFLYEAFSCETGVIVGFAFRFSLLCVSALGAIFWFLNRKKVNDAYPSEDRDSHPEIPN
ncbi:flippase-like domain-containing protein [Mariniblastus sp.]|nr:flippase-like domain-containing protein [bacterium]MDC0294606.1 flippase-like domain-containing protein [Mariniblastus sp.]MDC3224469.1 flippase-like domain-containing protein [Mariniblastus sp.]